MNSHATSAKLTCARVPTISNHGATHPFSSSAPRGEKRPRADSSLLPALRPSPPAALSTVFEDEGGSDSDASSGGSLASSGITAFIFHSRLGLLGTFPVSPEGQTDTTVRNIALLPGDTLDFILDSQGSDNSDSFAWSPVIRDLTTQLILADATADFGGPGASALAAYAQVLLCSNEFLFLD